MPQKHSEGSPAALPAELAPLVQGYAWSQDTAGKSGATVHRLSAPGRPSLYLKHGDFLLGNILLDEHGVTGCIDVGRAGIADPYQDIAILWDNLAELGGDLQARFRDAYGIAALDERRLRFHLP